MAERQTNIGREVWFGSRTHGRGVALWWHIGQERSRVTKGLPGHVTKGWQGHVTKGWQGYVTKGWQGHVTKGAAEPRVREKPWPRDQGAGVHVTS